MAFGTVYPGSMSVTTFGSFALSVIDGDDTPYTWTLLTNNSGATIAPDGDGSNLNAIYSPGTLSGVKDQILIEGQTSGSQIVTVSVISTLQQVCDIIQTGIGSAGTVYIFDQKYNIPTDEKMYVAVGIQACKAFANNTFYNVAYNELGVVQTVNMQATLSIDILSRSTAAIANKELVIASFNSPFSQQTQAANSMYLAPLTTHLVNLSKVDGMAIPYRFQMLVNMQYFVKVPSVTDYYQGISVGAVVVDDGPG